MKSTIKAALPSLAMPAVISLELWVLTAGPWQRTARTEGGSSFSLPSSRSRGIFVWVENFFAKDDEPSDQET